MRELWKYRLQQKLVQRAQNVTCNLDTRDLYDPMAFVLQLAYVESWKNIQYAKSELQVLKNTQKKLKGELDSLLETINSSKRTFSQLIHSDLIKSNKKKYISVVNDWEIINWMLLNSDAKNKWKGMWWESVRCTHELSEFDKRTWPLRVGAPKYFKFQANQNLKTSETAVGKEGTRSPR